MYITYICREQPVLFSRVSHHHSCARRPKIAKGSPVFVSNLTRLVTIRCYCEDYLLKQHKIEIRDVVESADNIFSLVLRYLTAHKVTEN